MCVFTFCNVSFYAKWEFGKACGRNSRFTKYKKNAIIKSRTNVLNGRQKNRWSVLFCIVI